eukprot:3532675-Rhodomonas_salina.7
MPVLVKDDKPGQEIGSVAWPRPRKYQKKCGTLNVIDGFNMAGQCEFKLETSTTLMHTALKKVVSSIRFHTNGEHAPRSSPATTRGRPSATISPGSSRS